MNSKELKNIYDNLPLNLDEEFFEKLIETENFTLERIVSAGHSSPKDFWYDQDRNEFVIVISGSATIKYFDGEIFNLNPGDYLIIPAHQKHRVEKTSETEKTIWLAIHF